MTNANTNGSSNGIASNGDAKAVEPPTPADTKPSSDPAAIESHTPVRVEALDVLADLRLDAEPADLEAVRIQQAVARKPHPDEFFRVHPTTAMNVKTVENTRQRVEYIVARPAIGVVRMKLKERRIILCANSFGELFLWAVGMPGPGAAPNPWLSTAHRAVELAKVGWVRIMAGNGYYEIDRPAAGNTLPLEVTWPEAPIGELIHAAYVGRIITGPDHPMIDELRGVTR